MNKQVNQHKYGNGQLQFSAGSPWFSWGAAWSSWLAQHGQYLCLVLLGEFAAGLLRGFFSERLLEVLVPSMIQEQIVWHKLLPLDLIMCVYTGVFFEVKTRSDCPLTLSKVVTAKAISTAGCSVCPKHLCYSKQCCSKRMVVQIAGMSLESWLSWLSTWMGPRGSSHCSDPHRIMRIAGRIDEISSYNRTNLIHSYPTFNIQTWFQNNSKSCRRSKLTFQIQRVHVKITPQDSQRILQWPFKEKYIECEHRLPESNMLEATCQPPHRITGSPIQILHNNIW